MAFEDLTELIEPLELPIRGKVYRLPAVSFEDGLRLKSLLDGAPDSSLTDADVNRILLGDVRDQLEFDGVPAEWIGRVLLVALTDYKSGRFSAEVMWKTGGDPKELDKLVKATAPNRAARRASKRSPSTGEAGTTKPPASTSGTKTSRKK
jgi:hypothetical protein